MNERHTHTHTHMHAHPCTRVHEHTLTHTHIHNHTGSTFALATPVPPDPSSNLFQKGDRVRVKPSVIDLKFGWGKVKRAQVGFVKNSILNAEVMVAFKDVEEAKFLESELEWVFRVGDRVKALDKIFAAATTAARSKGSEVHKGTLHLGIRELKGKCIGSCCTCQKMCGGGCGSSHCHGDCKWTCCGQTGRRSSWPACSPDPAACTHCPQSHSLQMSKKNSGYRCDLCNDDKTGNRMHCDTCDYDVCETCTKKGASLTASRSAASAAASAAAHEQSLPADETFVVTSTFQLSVESSQRGIILSSLTDLSKVRIYIYIYTYVCICVY